MHQHKAIPHKSKDYGWTVCVTPTECAAHPRRQAAHGNIVRLDVCSCGATRDFEVGDRVEAGEGEDFDQGRIVSISGGMATVAWDSGVRTPASLEDLVRG